MTDLAQLSVGMFVLDFTARWCGPCKQLQPTLAALERDYRGRMRVVEIDVDDDPLLAQQFSVRAMPTLVLWRDGREVGRIVGARSKSFVAGALERALGGDTHVTCP